MANVLVIDDDAQIRSLLKILLEEGGHDVRIAGEGGEGIRLCRDCTPDLVITDAGTNAVGWERFESDYFPVLNLTRPGMTERPCLILGSLCTPHDVWGASYWGEDIRCGDVLMIPAQGAYVYSLRQHFIKPLPSVVTI